MNNSVVCVVWFSVIADGFAIICTKNYENGTQFYHLNSNSCKKGIAKLHVHKCYKHGGLVIMDIEYMFKTYEAFT